MGIAQSHAGSLVVSSISVNPYEPRLVGSVGFLVVPLTPLDPKVLPPLVRRIPQAPSNVWLWVSTSVPISIWMNPH